MWDENVLFRQVEGAWHGVDLVDVYCGVFCLVNWLGLCALGLVFLVLTDYYQIGSAHLLQILLNHLRCPFLHEEWVSNNLLNLHLM